MHALWISDARRIQDDKLKDIMHTAFKARLAEIFDHSQHDIGHSAGAQDAADFIAGLDDWEKERE